MRALQFFVLVIGVLSFGCQAEKAPNEIVVIVDSDMRIGSDLKSLDVEISDRSLDAGVLSSNHFELVADGTNATVGQFTLPLSFVIAPTSQQSTRDFRLAVSGHDLDDVEVVVERQLISSFRPDFSGRLVVFLAQRCVQQLCRLDNGQRSADTCNPATGRCEQTPEVQPEPFSGGDGLAGYQRADADAGPDAAPTPRADAGSSEDASVPVADGAVPGNDAGVPDAGPPPTQRVDTSSKTIAASGLLARAAASVSGRGAVVYQTRVGGSDQYPAYAVYAAVFEPDTGWGAPIALATTSVPDQSDSDVHAIFDTQGNLTVVWMRRGYSMVARRNIASKRSWDDELVVRTSDASSGISLAVDPSGNVMVAFGGDAGATLSARWETKTQRWNGGTGAVNDANSLFGETPMLTSDAAGNITALWATFEGGKVFANRFDASTARWGVPVVLRSSPQTSRTYSSQIAARNDGAVIAMWREIQDAQSFVGANLWDPQRMAWRGNMPESGALRVGEGTASAVAADPEGVFVAFWDNHMRTNDGSAIASFTPAVPVGREGVVNMADWYSATMGVDARGKRVVAWAQNAPGGVDVAWSWAARPTGNAPEQWSDPTLFDAKLPPGGSNSTNTYYNLGWPTMSIGSPGTALIVWNQALNNDDSPPTSVYARWVTF